MLSYLKQIEKHIATIPENQIIIANKLYHDEFCEIPEAAYYKAMERLSKSGILRHITKGIYCRPKLTKFGPVPVSADEICSYFTDHNQGLIVGYHMYNKYGITTQISKQYEVLTNAITEDKKSICNVSLKKLGLRPTPERLKALEALELLQGFTSIEDANETALVSYMKSFAKNYSDTNMEYILFNRKYKKSTIAFMEYFLNAFSVENSLAKHLSKLSNYNFPRMEGLV